MTRCVALLSGGLDSMLAIRVMQEQGIEVESLNFKTMFELFQADDTDTGVCRSCLISVQLNGTLLVAFSQKAHTCFY